MADQANDTTDQAAAPISAERFATVVTDMSRFLSRLATYGPLQEAGIGVTEWTALVSLGSAPGSNKALAKELGLTKQRVTQVTDALKKAGLIEVTKSPDDARLVELKVTDTGRQHRDTVNAKLAATLTAAFDGKERALLVAEKSIKAMSKALAEPRAAKGTAA